MNEYEPSLDSYYIALRAITRLVRSARWPELSTIGITRSAHFEALDDALLEINSHLPLHRTAERLVRECPWLLDAASHLLAAYYGTCAQSRADWDRTH